MARVKLVTRDGIEGVRFHCPGCDCSHFVYTQPNTDWGYHWHFNGDVESPTLSPSVDGLGPDRKGRCHSHVTDGRIAYLPDSTHALSGQTVDLPELS